MAEVADSPQGADARPAAWDTSGPVDAPRTVLSTALDPVLSTAVSTALDPAVSTAVSTAVDTGPLGARPVALAASGDPQNRSVDPKAKVRLSDMLSAIARDEQRDRISISDLLASMDGRAMGALLLVFALPNVLPSLPGTSAVLGLPLIYLTSQMMLGRLPWLPKFIASRSLSRRDFANLIERMEPWLARAERFLQPRWNWLAHESVERLIGAVALLLSVILILPIPLGNMLPALAICLFALGLMEHDGVWVIAGAVVAVVATSVVAGVLFALAKSVIFVLHGAFA